MEEKRKSRTKHTHACAYCGLRFAKISDHMSHVLDVHHAGFRRHEDRLKRPVSCWSCGTKDMMPRESDSRYACECGFVLPDGWTNGQLAPEGGFPPPEPELEPPAA